MAKKSTEDLETQRNNFIIFNTIIIVICVLLYFISNYLPSNIRISNISTFIYKYILPLVYFALFSFIFGLLYLYGEIKMHPYLKNTITDNDILVIGIIASYTGSISILLSMFMKSIIEQIINRKIISNSFHDLGGFIIGRIILLSCVFIFNLNNSTNKKKMEDDV